MEEAKYFIFIVKTEDNSEDRFEMIRSFRPIIKFFGSKKDAEEWVAKKGTKYNLVPDEFSGRCLAAWKGKKGGDRRNWTKVKVALFKVSTGQFTQPEGLAIYV